MINPLEASEGFYKTAVTHWDRLKANGDFQEAYEPITQLDQRGREDLLLHDIRNTLTTNILRTRVYTNTSPQDIEAILELNRNIVIPDGVNGDNLEALVRTFQALPMEPSEKALARTDKRATLERELNILDICKQVLPTLASSVQFLDSPSAFYLNSLMQPTITAEQLGLFFNAQIRSPNRRQRLRGIELMSALNLLHNATKFHDRWQSQSLDPEAAEAHRIQFHVQGRGSFIVENRSLTGLPEDRDIMLPGVHGDGGATGYGLTIAHIYARIAGSTIEKRSMLLPDNKPGTETPDSETHVVSFWVKPQAQRNEPIKLALAN